MLVGDTLCVPLVPLVPVQPPLAVHELALLLDHVKVELLPEVMVAGFAPSVAVGAAGGVVGESTVIVTDEAWELPPVPEHVSVYVVVLVGETLCVPLVALTPVQAPLAEQVLAFLLDQVRVELVPETIVVLLAANVAVGADGGTGVPAVTTVIDVGSHDEVSPVESIAHTLKSYLPGIVGVPVRFPFGLRTMPSGGVPAERPAV